ncbi:MAG: hypothetical protein ACYCUG_08615 [Acidimicrobiales bacterium]
MVTLAAELEGIRLLEGLGARERQREPRTRRPEQRDPRPVDGRQRCDEADGGMPGDQQHAGGRLAPALHDVGQHITRRRGHRSASTPAGSRNMTIATASAPSTSPRAEAECARCGTAKASATGTSVAPNADTVSPTDTSRKLQ